MAVATAQQEYSPQPYGDAREALPEGTILDGCYEIRRVVGSGGFAITYEAIDTNLGTTIAIKEYYPAEFGYRDGSFSVRARSASTRDHFDQGKDNFLREARTLARFNHPNIVRVLRVFEAHDTAYIAMRFESGLSFDAWLNGLGRIPNQEELDGISSNLLSALEDMHGTGLVHRDIAPDNIIIRDDGTPVLLDFGAAKRASAERTRTIAGIVKLGYSPQEQYSTDSIHQGPWSDFYALGGSLYRAITGFPPPEAPVRFGHDTLRPATEAGAGRFRADFLNAIDWCLKLRPVDRPQNVTALRARMGLEIVTTDAIPLPPPEVVPANGSMAASAGKWLLVLSAAVLVSSGGYLGVNAYMDKMEIERGQDAGRKRAEQERLKTDELARQQRQASVDEELRRRDRQREDSEQEQRKRDQEIALERQKREAEEQKIADEKRAAEEQRIAKLEAERLRAESRPTGDELNQYAGKVGGALQKVQCFNGLSGAKLADVQTGINRFADRMHAIGRQGPPKLEIASANIGQLDTWLGQVTVLNEKICQSDSFSGTAPTQPTAPPAYRPPPSYTPPAAPRRQAPSPGGGGTRAPIIGIQ